MLSGVNVVSTFPILRQPETIVNGSRMERYQDSISREVSSCLSSKELEMLEILCGEEVMYSLSNQRRLQALKFSGELVRNHVQ